MEFLNFKIVRRETIFTSPETIATRAQELLEEAARGLIGHLALAACNDPLATLHQLFEEKQPELQVHINDVRETHILKPGAVIVINDGENSLGLRVNDDDDPVKIYVDEVTNLPNFFVETIG